MFFVIQTRYHPICLLPPSRLDTKKITNAHAPASAVLLHPDMYPTPD